MAKYVIIKAHNGRCWWVLKRLSGETLLTSEIYATKQHCLEGVAESRNCIGDADFDRLTSRRNKPYFLQTARKMKILAESELYLSVLERDAGIETVKCKAPTAPVEDLSAFGR